MNGPNSPSVGPSDSSDSGADLIGAGLKEEQLELSGELAVANGNFSTDATTDRNGTGERAAAGPEEVPDAADIGFDRVVGASEAGLGAGLDQAEEAQLGITDDELATMRELDQ